MKFIPGNVRRKYCAEWEAFRASNPTKHQEEQDVEGPLTESDPSGVSDLRAFLSVSALLWKNVAKTILALDGSEIWCPGLIERGVAEVFLLGCDGCTRVTPEAAREEAVVRSDLEPAQLEDHLSSEHGGKNLLQSMETLNKQNPLLLKVVRLLNSGKWSYGFFPESWDADTANDTFVVIHFEVFGLLGMVILTECFVEPFCDHSFL